MLPVPARGAGSGRARRWVNRRLTSLPMQAYTTPTTLPLNRTGQAAISDAGIAQVAMGPAGTGSKWYPQAASMSTTSGGPSACVCGIYFGVVSVTNLLGLYGGYGDSAGIAIPFLAQGDLLIFEWVNGTPGDLAQVTVTGSQDVLA
jgi:hypothetical protein